MVKHAKQCDCSICAYNRAHAIIDAWRANIKPPVNVYKTILVRAHWRKGRHMTALPSSRNELRKLLREELHKLLRGVRRKL